MQTGAPWNSVGELLRGMGGFAVLHRAATLAFAGVLPFASVLFFLAFGCFGVAAGSLVFVLC